MEKSVTRSESMHCKKAPILEYHAYRLHDRPGDFNTPLRGKRLAQAYVVDGYCCVQEVSQLDLQLAKGLFCLHPSLMAHAIYIRIIKTVLTYAENMGAQIYLLPSQRTQLGPKSWKL